MDKRRVNLYSSLLRFLLIIFTVSFPLFYNDKTFNIELLQNSFKLSVVLITLSIHIIGQIVDKFKITFSILSLISSIVLYFIYDKIIILMIVLCILDILVLFNLNLSYGFFVFALCPYSGEHYFIFIFFTLLIIFLYFLIYTVINVQSDYIESKVKNEMQLLAKIRTADRERKAELNRTILKFENQRLKEKSELSQNLHDKIGHAINGSIFKLEGAKLLIEKDSSKSRVMVEDVISALRESVDEIRLLLRNEKPSTEIMNINKLKTLFIDFADKYGIETNINVRGDTSKIPYEYFNILFDNTIEALSNSLKYSKCTKIDASLQIFNKIIRYSISDNGVGAEVIKENMGISGMKDRISSIDGKLIISGDNGFKINMLIPIPESN